MSDGRHILINADTLAPASGFSHVVIAEHGRTVYIAGQIGCDAAGAIDGGGFVSQFDAALANVVAALDSAGALPEHVVSMTIYTTTMDQYRRHRADIGEAYRARFDRHFPAMTMVGVTELVEPTAVVEITATAVVPPA